MGKRIEKSFKEFLRVTKTESPAETSKDMKKINIDLEWSDQERQKFVHDLFSATNSFKALIELNQLAIKSPTEREKKKFLQLMTHAERLEEIIQFASELFEEESNS